MFVLKALIVSALTLTAKATDAENPVVTTDVLVIGGGVSGAYAAVKLREDLGKKIVVVEKKARVGGHIDTWYDPVNKKPFDFGVQIFTNLTVARDFFARFNLSVVNPTYAPSTGTIYADFSTGKAVNYTPPTSTEFLDATKRYRVQWEKYQSLMLPTSFGFPAGKDIPEDLLLSWADFAHKYQLLPVGPKVHYEEIPDMNMALMIDVWKAYDPSIGAGGLRPASRDNSEIFNKIALLLGKDIWYESQVISTERRTDGVKVVVKANDGGLTTVLAKKLLIAAPPETLDKTTFALTDEETAIFSSVKGNRYYAGLVTHPSLLARTVINTVPEAAPSNFLVFPKVPFSSYFSFQGNSSAGPLYRVVVIVSKETTEEVAREMVRSSLQKLLTAGTIPAGDVKQLDFKAFVDHGLLYRGWTDAQLRDDIVRRAWGLQGSQSTWYTGAFWMNDNAAMLWSTTDAILERMLMG